MIKNTRKTPDHGNNRAPADSSRGTDVITKINISSIIGKIKPLIHEINSFLLSEIESTDALERTNFNIGMQVQACETYELFQALLEQHGVEVIHA